MDSAQPIEVPVQLLRARRAAALERLAGGVMVLPAAPLQFSSRDGAHPYHPDRELFYLTGATEPGSVAVLADGEMVLFVRDRDPEAELWDGERLGPERTSERLGPDRCHSTKELDALLPELLQRGDRIFFRLGRGDRVERHVLAALATARSRGPRTGTGPRAVVDPGEIIDDLRLVKDAHELHLIRRAADISVEGHLAGVAAMAPGVGEWAVQAAIEARFRALAGDGPAFETIVGSGGNACVLHYRDNRDLIEDGALVLVDAGATFGLYHGDITRTYPVSGSFSPAQQDVYEVVEVARRAAVQKVCPGGTVADVHDEATRVLVVGLLALGCLDGDPAELVAEEAYKPFFPHQTSHWLGLDVHDPGDYARGGTSRVLEPGMVLTVEPGLYFRPEAVDVPKSLAGIGVRIEDDVVVTESGSEVVTSALPTTVTDIAALVGDSA